MESELKCPMHFINNVTIAILNWQVSDTNYSIKFERISRIFLEKEESSVSLGSMNFRQRKRIREISRTVELSYAVGTFWKPIKSLKAFSKHRGIIRPLVGKYIPRDTWKIPASIKISYRRGARKSRERIFLFPPRLCRRWKKRDGFRKTAFRNFESTRELATFRYVGKYTGELNDKTPRGSSEDRSLPFTLLEI